MENLFPKLFGGNTQFGAPVAQKAAAGSANLKVAGPTDQVVTVGGSAGTVATPDGGQVGQLAIPTEIAPTRKFKLTINTTNETEDYKNVVLFDALDIYKNSKCGDCPCDDAVESSCVYIGKGPDCSLYPSILKELISKAYVVTALRIVVQGTNLDVTPNAVLDTITSEIEVFKGNIGKQSYNDNFDFMMHVDQSNQIQHIIDVPMVGQPSRIDGSTAWLWTLPKNVKVDMYFTVGVRA